MQNSVRMFLLATVFSCAAVAQGDRELTRNIEYAGAARTYHLALPQDFDPAKTYWAMVAAHGGGGVARNAKAASLRREADAQGLAAILVLPELSTADKQVSRFPSLGEGAFLEAVLQEVRRDFRVHEKILLTGYSMGGQFSHRFALAHPEHVQACAPLAAGTWTTPEGRLLVEAHGEVVDAEAFLKNDANKGLVPERLHDLFDPRVPAAATLPAAPGAERVPFLVMCGTLDPRLAIAEGFVASLKAQGYTVEAAWPRTPHGNEGGQYGAEFEKYAQEVVRFFLRCVAPERSGER